MPNPFQNGKAHILMCPPDYFGIEYAINPWMNSEQEVDHATAVVQWNALRALLEKLGATIHTMPPVKGLPDLVFTANAAIVYKNKVIVSRFQHEQRQGEEQHDEAWLREHGFEIVDIPDGLRFEGAGDALFCGDTLFAGYSKRSDAAGHQKIAELLGFRIIPLELVSDHFYHLDTCFCPISPTEAIYFPDAFDAYGKRTLKEHVPTLIPIEPHEAERFGCNAVVVGKSVVTNTGCEQLHATLRTCGYEPHETPMDEFLKAGGSSKCLTLRLDGEEAADWKRTR